MSDSEKLFFELKSDVPPSAQEYHDSKRDDGSGSVEPSLPAFAQSESNLVGFVPPAPPRFDSCSFAHLNTRADPST